jgi:hypothetical protein
MLIRGLERRNTEWNGIKRRAADRRREAVVLSETLSGGRLSSMIILGGAKNLHHLLN